MSRYLPFTPFPAFSGPHAQTILAGAPTYLNCPPSVTRLIPLADGDRIACEVSTPQQWQADQLTVFTLHGLCGSHRSPYQVRLSRKLYSQGVRVVRINLRGCGSGAGLAKKPYHAGCSDDLLSVLQVFRPETPKSPFRAAAYSLGGNVLLKLVGELGGEAREYLDQVVAICPPINLHTSSKLMAKPGNLFYRLSFTRWLIQEVRSRERYFPSLEKSDVWWTMTFREFDDQYTAPQAGFRSAMDYYTSCSAELLIPRIQVNTKIIFSEDDPIIDCGALDHLKLDNHLKVYKTHRGGHMGFYGHPRSPGGVHWLDEYVLDWLIPLRIQLEQKIEESSPPQSLIRALPPSRQLQKGESNNLK